MMFSFKPHDLDDLTDDALTDRVPDNDNTVPPDTSFYWEHN